MRTFHEGMTYNVHVYMYMKTHTRVPHIAQDSQEISHHHPTHHIKNRGLISEEVKIE